MTEIILSKYASCGALISATHTIHTSIKDGVFTVTLSDIRDNSVSTNTFDCENDARRYLESLKSINASRDFGANLDDLLEVYRSNVLVVIPLNDFWRVEISLYMGTYQVDLHSVSARFSSKLFDNLVDAIIYSYETPGISDYKHFSEGIKMFADAVRDIE